MRGVDWSRTPVGPPDSWRQSLRTALGITLDSLFPMYIAWGPEFAQFYNDAYRPIWPMAYVLSQFGLMCRDVGRLADARVALTEELVLRRQMHAQQSGADAQLVLGTVLSASVLAMVVWHATSAPQPASGSIVHTVAKKPAARPGGPQSNSSTKA